MAISVPFSVTKLRRNSLITIKPLLWQAYRDTNYPNLSSSQSFAGKN